MTKRTLPDLATREEDPEAFEELVRIGLQEVLKRSAARVPKHRNPPEANVLPSTLDLRWVEDKDLLKAHIAKLALAIPGTPRMSAVIHQAICDALQDLRSSQTSIPGTEAQEASRALSHLEASVWHLAHYARELEDIIQGMAIPISAGDLVRSKGHKLGGDASAKKSRERREKIQQDAKAIRQKNKGKPQSLSDIARALRHLYEKEYGKALWAREEGNATEDDVNEAKRYCLSEDRLRHIISGT